MMKKSSSSAVNRFSVFAISALIALFSGLLVIPEAADRSRSRSSQTQDTTNLVTTFLRALNPVPAANSIINVNSTAQSPGATGDCTLGEAIQAANGNAAVDGCSAGSSAGIDTIMLPAGTYTLTTPGFTHAFFGSAGLPGITTDVVVQGAGSESTIIERSSGAAAQFRLMVVANQSAGSVVLNDLTMRGGRSADLGGALYTGGRPATLNRVVFDDNHAAKGGAVTTSDQGGVLVANDCTFINNQATGTGGAIVSAQVTISRSSFTGNSAVSGGALFYVQGGGASFNIADSTFTNNQTLGGNGGAINFDGVATISRSQFTGNLSTVQGGAISASGNNGGTFGALNLSDTVVNGNQADYAGGLRITNCSVNISRSTISNNRATQHFGGGMYLLQNPAVSISSSTVSGNTSGINGGGIWSSDNNLTLTNVTIDGNTAVQGGGIYHQDFPGTKTVILNNATIAGNRATNHGGGLFRASGTITFRNSILALNTSDINIGPDIYADLIFSGGFNFVGIKSGANFSNGAGDQTGDGGNPIDPLLGPLQNNGGPTFTRALLSGSPAIDAANPAVPGSDSSSCETLDQRGISRPEDGDNNTSAICDIGAFEQVRVPVCIPPPSGISAWWPFDGSADDTQGVNHSTLAGGPTFADGKVDQALTFDGIDDHAVIPAATALDIGSGDGMTFDVWINPSEIQTARPLVEWNNAAGIEGPHLWMSADFAVGGQGVGSLFVNLRDTDGNFHIFSSAPGVVAANTWQHIAVSYDKTSGVAKIYLNGTAVAQQNLGSFRPQTTTDLYLGFRPIGILGGRRFLGAMDEVELFNRALEESEIQAIYYADFAGKCKPDPSPTPTPSPAPAVIEVTEQITVSDTRTLLPSAMIGVNENISVLDTSALLPSALIGVNENISVFDTPTLLLSAMIGVDENISVLDTPTLLTSAMIGINENISVLDTSTLLPSAMIGVNENIFLHDMPSLLPSAMIGVNENISVRDTSVLLPSAMIGIFENINVRDSAALLLTPILSSFPTSTGTNVTVSSGKVAITFAKVTSAGTTTITPISISETGQVPAGYQLFGTSFAFDITTTAQYSGLMTICFNLPEITDPAVFASLRIMHNENGILVDRTTSSAFASKTICGTVKSLSPFVVAQLMTSPQLLLQSTLNDLLVLREGTRDKRVRLQLDEIIKQLREVIDAANWEDQSHLRLNGGEGLLGKIESAIQDLNELSKDKKTSLPSLQNFMKQLALSVRLLAQTAIIDASANHSSPTEISNAIEALFEGDTKFANANYNQAVVLYRQAWLHALNRNGNAL